MRPYALQPMPPLPHIIIQEPPLLRHIITETPAASRISLVTDAPAASRTSHCRRSCYLSYITRYRRSCCLPFITHYRRSIVQASSLSPAASPHLLLRRLGLGRRPALRWRRWRAPALRPSHAPSGDLQ